MMEVFKLAMCSPLPIVFLLLMTPGLLAAKSPNILFVLMDDVGHRDLGFVDDTFHTPTIDKLYSEGLRLNFSYTPPNCGPSRAALLSGAFSFRMGLQGNGMRASGGGSIPLDHKLLPQKLQELGYSTHLIGKWHQGHCTWDQYPTKRGFDSFYGFLGSNEDHFLHASRKKSGDTFYDFRFNEAVDFSVLGKYSVDIFSQRACTIIREQKDTDKPFFILLSHAAIHKPNQVPQRYIDEYCQRVSASDTDRRIKCGMMAAVDEGLKNILDDLDKEGLRNNTLIVFTSDNGGGQTAGSSNWPLRGGKGTMWEGGIRVRSFLHSPNPEILPHTKWTYNGLFHQVDWYGTLWGFATQNTKKQIDETPDGFNMWEKFTTGDQTSFRDGFAYIDGGNVSYIRHRHWKLIIGETRESGWYTPPAGFEEKKQDVTDEDQLFHIGNDPFEKKNKANNKQDIVRKLRDILNDKYWPIWKPEIQQGAFNADPYSEGNLWMNGVISPGYCNMACSTYP